MTTIAVIYHKNCSDGLASAACAHLYFTSRKTNVDYYPMHYGDPFDVEWFRNKSVYILDFSFKKEDFNKIREVARYVVNLDHHITALEEYKDFFNSNSTMYEEDFLFMHFDIEQCGAMLAHGYFFGDVRIPSVIRHIDDRDRWQWKLSKSKEDDTDSLAQIGHILVEKTNQEVKSIIKFAKITTNDNTRVAIVNCPTNLVSEVGNTLCSTLDIDYAHMFYVNAVSDKVIHSLRSTGSFDVASIARSFGGGGHLNAAGYTEEL